MSLAHGSADLHLHTPASDGTDDVSTRLEQAAERGLAAIAITDHDVIGDDLDRRVTTRGGIELITGLEVRADLFDTKIELLGYYVDPDNTQLESVLGTARQYRRERNRTMIERLNDVTGASLAYDTLRQEADDNLGRPHLAERLVQAGVVDSIGEAFDSYVGSDGDAYVPMERLPYTQVIDAIHTAGGVASLAHPGRIRSRRVPEMVEQLVEAGLDGLEVWYPYDETGPAAYADIGVSEAMELADRHGVVPTGGSDCHGAESDKFRIGSVRAPEDSIKSLRRAAGLSQERN